MKAVLLSIQPKWCELIASGKKTVEVRKTRPKIETPFKCYIYMTAGDASYPVTVDGFPMICHNNGGMTVIGEFVCNEIYSDTDFNVKTRELLHNACLTLFDIAKYLKPKQTAHFWHISNLIIYDKPKELSEFKTVCKSYHDGDKCDDCKYFIDGRGYEYDESDCACDGLKPIERPPQSWCYLVEELR